MRRDRGGAPRLAPSRLTPRRRRAAAECVGRCAPGAHGRRRPLTKAVCAVTAGEKGPAPPRTHPRGVRPRSAERQRPLLSVVTSKQVIVKWQKAVPVNTQSLALRTPPNSSGHRGSQTKAPPGGGESACRLRAEGHVLTPTAGCRNPRVTLPGRAPSQRGGAHAPSRTGARTRAAGLNSKRAPGQKGCAW